MAQQQIQDPRRKTTGPFSAAPDLASQQPNVPAPANPTAAAGAAPDVLPTQIVRPGSAKLPPQVGGMPSIPNPVSAIATTLTAPKPLLPGQAAPDINPQAAGTRFGNALLDARKSVLNGQADVLNAGTTAGANIANTATTIPRAIGGFVRDAARAVVGAEPSANAGQPLSGITAPTLTKPFQKPVVDFSVTDTPPSPANGTGAMGGTPTYPELPAVTPAQNAPVADNISQSNLAAAMRMNAPDNGSGAGGTALKMPGVDTGVNIGSRHLNYGAMVNGVPTFSDGSSGIAGVAGKIPRTMSDQTIAGLGARLPIIPAQTSVLASDALGGATPTQGQMVAQRMAQIQQPITGSRPSAKQFADADRLAIAQRDPRSAAGIAARNLTIDAQYGSPRLRRMAESALADLQSGSQQSSLAAQQAEAQAANTATTGQNALQAIQLQGQNALADTALTAKLRAPTAGQLVQAADGSYTLVNPSTAATTPVLQDGKPLKGQPKNPPAPIFTTPGGFPALQSLANSYLGADEFGQVPDEKNPGKTRAVTGDERYKAMQWASQHLQQLGAGQPAAATSKAPSAGTVSGGYRFKGGDPAVQSNWEKV